MQGIKEVKEMHTTGPLPPGSFSGEVQEQQEGSLKRQRRERATGRELPRTDRIG